MKVKDKLKIILQKEDNLIELFSKLKTKKTAQQLKDESKEGWD